MGKQWMSWYPTCKRNKIAQGETLFLHVFTDGLRPGVHQKTSQVPNESKKHVMWVEQKEQEFETIWWNYILHGIIRKHGGMMVPSV